MVAGSLMHFYVMEKMLKVGCSFFFVSFLLSRVELLRKRAYQLHVTYW